MDYAAQLKALPERQDCFIAFSISIVPGREEASWERVQRGIGEIVNPYNISNIRKAPVC